MVAERTALWAATATTADLLFAYHKGQDHVWTYRQVITTEGLTSTQVDAYAKAIEDELEIVRLCVVELRRRGHNV